MIMEAVLLAEGHNKLLEPSYAKAVPTKAEAHTALSTLRLVQYIMWHEAEKRQPWIVGLWPIRCLLLLGVVTRNKIEY